MGAAVPGTALRSVLNADTTLDILSFLDDSSLVITYGSESSDIANFEDVGGRYDADHILPRFGSVTTEVCRDACTGEAWNILIECDYQLQRAPFELFELFPSLHRDV